MLRLITTSIALGFTFICTNLYSQCSECDHVFEITSPGDVEIIDGNTIDYEPGDVLCIRGGTYETAIRFLNFHGTKFKPITFQNCEGQVILHAANAGALSFFECSFLKLSGTGQSGVQYGIKVAESLRNGVTFLRGSTDFEVENIEVTNTGFAGLQAKTDPNCNQLQFTKENFIMQNLSIHDNYIHETSDEAFYLGNTVASVTCDGVEYFSHRARNVEVYNNLVENPGWDGIQVTTAEEGASVHDNVIIGYGSRGNPIHNYGMSLGTLRGEIYNNLIVQRPENYLGASSSGIQLISGFDVLFYNNVIVKPERHGIFAHNRLENPLPTEGYFFIHNTIIQPNEGSGIFYNSTLPSTQDTREDLPNAFFNNIVADPGRDYSSSGFWKGVTEDYFDFSAKEQRDAAVANNALQGNVTIDAIGDLSFIDAANNNYDIGNMSVAKDIGIDVSSYNISTDLNGKSRVIGAAADAGAFEFSNSNNAPINIKQIPDQPVKGRVDALLDFIIPDNIFVDGDGDDLTYSASLSDDSPLPAWLLFDGIERTFSGTPIIGDLGLLEIKITVDDGNAGSTTTQFNILVATNFDPELNNPLKSISASVGSNFTSTISEDAFIDFDGDALTYNVTLANDSALPSWLTFTSGTRVLSGVPITEDIGILEIKLVANDGAGGIASTITTLTIIANSPPIVDDVSDQGVAVAATLNFVIPEGAFDDPDEDVLTYSASLADDSALPAWLSFNATTRTLSGTPTVDDIGELVIKITATDGISSAVSLTFKLSVTPEVLPEDCGCDITFLIDNSKDVNIIDGDKMSYSPGNVLCLSAGTYTTGIRFLNFHGTEQDPLIFKNCDGQVILESADVGALSFWGCSHLKLTGTGNSAVQYGIKITESARNGVTFLVGSTDLEVEFLEVSGTGNAGIQAKTDPDCAKQEFSRANFIMENLSFHDNYIHDTGDEGFYVGNTSIAKMCDGTVVEGHQARNVEIYDNLVENAGFDGIQLTTCIEEASIHDNVVMGYGAEGNSIHNFGFSLGGGMRGDVYNNLIAQIPENYLGTESTGIQLISGNDVVFYNNVILRPEDRGIFVHNRFSDPVPTEGYYFVNNTIVNPGGSGIFYNSTTPGGPSKPELPNAFLNNIIINPGQDYSNTNLWKGIAQEYIDFSGQGEHDMATMGGNFTTDNPAEILFVDFANDDFNLTETSPTIDIGTDVSQFNIITDFSGRPRVFGDAIDVGAFEFNPFVNNPPVLVKEIPDVSVAVGVTLDFTIPDGSFVDADEDDELTFSATLSDGAALPSWLSVNSSGTFSGVPTIDEVAVYGIALLADDGNEMGTATATFNITVTETDEGPEPEPGPGGVLTGIDDETEKEIINIYPNPTNAELVIDLSGTSVTQGKVILYNLLGSNGQSKIDIYNEKTVIDISNYTKGIYLIKVIDLNDQLLVWKKVIID